MSEAAAPNNEHRLVEKQLLTLSHPPGLDKLIIYLNNKRPTKASVITKSCAHFKM